MIKPERDGKTVLLIHMDDKYAVKPGTKGIIDHTDDEGQIHVKWENGRTLALIPIIDDFTILD